MAKETENKGFILLHRGIMDWQHWSDANTLKVWLVLLFSASYEKGWRRGVKCKRGETMITLDELRDKTGFSRPTLIRILGMLENTGEILRIKIDQKHTKTIIKKYSNYQCFINFSGKTTLPQTLPQTLPNKRNKQNNIVENKKRVCACDIYNNIISDLFANTNLIENFAYNNYMTLEQCRRTAEDVVTEWQLTGEEHATATEARKHLLNAIRIKAQSERATLVGKQDRDKRLQPLIDDCKQLITEGNDRKDVAEFYAYYTQTANDGTQRMLFETLAGWETKTRFIRYNKKKA